MSKTKPLKLRWIGKPISLQLLVMVFRPISPWTEARLQSTRSSTEPPLSPRRLRRLGPSPGVAEVRSFDRAEQLARQASVAQAAASRTAPGSLDTIMPPRRPPSPEKVVEPFTMVVHSPRSNGESSPANSRRERYGIATIMSRGMQRQQPVTDPQPNTLTTQPVDTTQARATADNSFDSVPTDYDVSDTTSRSRSGEPVTTTSMDSSSSATGGYITNTNRKQFPVLLVHTFGRLQTKIGCVTADVTVMLLQQRCLDFRSI